MINYNELLEKTNPMDWHQLRFLQTMPKHFVPCRVKQGTTQLELFDWLLHNTVGRVAIAQMVEDPDVSFVLKRDLQVGFEDPAEATLFTLFFS